MDEFSNGYDIFEQVTHKAKPVAWIKNRNSLCFSIETEEVMLRDGWEPLYLAPPERECCTHDCNEGRDCPVRS